MRPLDHQFYMKSFRNLCVARKTPKLLYPVRDYIVQVARFDPSKGIPDVIRSYVKARHILDEEIPGSRQPQLCLVGHGAVDDPDATIIYDQIMELLETDEISPYASDIVVNRLPPSDQCITSDDVTDSSAQLDYGECEDRSAIVPSRGFRNQGLGGTTSWYPRHRLSRRWYPAANPTWQVRLSSRSRRHRHRCKTHR
jgi:hypothetical protein